jgi:nicotinate-nucleotide adenylyltransferase
VVALFGLSANPPTGEAGHRGIVRWLAETSLPEAGGRRVDEIWVLPVYRHAYTQKRDLAPFEDRLQMCRLAFGDLPRTRILDVERDVQAELDPAPAGTVDTLRHLRRRCPGCRFLLVLGQDTYRDLAAHRWKGSEELLSTTEVVVIRRPGAGGTEGHHVPALGPVSSTEARDAHDLERLLHDPVARYVRERGLYGLVDTGPGRIR